MSAPFLFAYTSLWRLSLPFLRRFPRLAEGWEERTLQCAPEGPFDLWMHAASGGESMLAEMVLDRLRHQIPPGARFKILATSNIAQGRECLEKGAASRTSGNLHVCVSYAPFDSPSLMARAFARFQPRLAVLVETELWPGFLLKAREKKTPVVVINGRMSAKSHRIYRRFSSFFQRVGPEKILAMSGEDAARFADLVGWNRVEIVPNLKFDKPSAVPDRNHFPHRLFAEDIPFLIFGAIRRQEEQQIISAIHQLLQRHPRLGIGLFPKHIERAQKIIAQLSTMGLTAKRRSTLDHVPASPGTIIVWDQFGELAAAYHLATAAFVGGSLCHRGGHNFLEPLTSGIRPLIGPHWDDFTWIGREIVKTGLVEEVDNWQELAEAMHNRLITKEDKAATLAQAERYLARRRGGTVATCTAIMQYLNGNTS